jgi:hypothetical protein
MDIWRQSNEQNIWTSGGGRKKRMKKITLRETS